MVRQDHQHHDQETTKLTDLPSVIAGWSHLIFGRICRPPRNTAASQALHLSIEVFTGISLAADWKCPPGRPWKNWLQQIEEDMGLPVTACQEHSCFTNTALVYRSLN